jgi:hypothetical protein
MSKKSFIKRKRNKPKTNRVCKEVTKDEFDKFIESYPRKLTTQISGMAEPSVLLYHDFEKYQGWEAVVGLVNLYERYSKDPKDYPYVWQPNKYSIWVWE